MAVQILLALVCGVFTESPEALLDSLCVHARGREAVGYWQSAADPAGTVPQADPDTLAALLSSRSGLSVEPGEDKLGDTGETHYVIIFADSRWSWTDGEGRQRVARGRTEVVFRDGAFYWRKLPFSAGSEGASMSGTHSLLLSMLATGALLVFAVLALWWARRRWA